MTMVSIDVSKAIHKILASVESLLYFKCIEQVPSTKLWPPHIYFDPTMKMYSTKNWTDLTKRYLVFPLGQYTSDTALEAVLSLTFC